MDSSGYSVLEITDEDSGEIMEIKYIVTEHEGSASSRPTAGSARQVIRERPVKGGAQGCKPFFEENVKEPL